MGRRLARFIELLVEGHVGQKHVDIGSELFNGCCEVVSRQELPAVPLEDRDP